MYFYYFHYLQDDLIFLASFSQDIKDKPSQKSTILFHCINDSIPKCLICRLDVKNCSGTQPCATNPVFRWTPIFKPSILHLLDYSLETSDVTAMYIKYITRTLFTMQIKFFISPWFPATVNGSSLCVYCSISSQLYINLTY